MKSSLQHSSVRAAVAAILSMAGGGISQVMAADDPAPALQEVTVTGTRILRRDAEANSPLVTVDAQTLETRSGLNVEEYLNELPNYNPAVTPETGNTSVGFSSISTSGISTISLRGFGSNRSLVLTDGHRVDPVNALMQVDINSIPSSMIKSVEIISGGASATYGADAIGGVTNFILNRDYEGLRADAQYGIAEVGDGQESRVSVLGGSKLASGKGHVTFGAEYYDREPAYQKNRSFFTDGWADPNTPGNFLGFFQGPSGYYTGTNLQTTNPGGAKGATILQNIVNAQGRSATANTGVFAYPGLGTNSSIRFLNNGQIFLPAGNNASTFDTSLINGSSYAYVNAYDTTYCNTQVCANNGTPLAPEVQTVKFNETGRYTSSPQTRYSFMSTLNYDITDKLHFNASGRFAQSETQTYLGRNTLTNGWEATIPYNATTDSPINPNLVLTQPIISGILTAPGGVVPTAYANPNFIPHGTKGAQHPVTPALAMLLNNRTATAAQAATGTPTCPAGVTVNCYNPLTAGWITEIYEYNGFDQRRTDELLSNWTIDSGLKMDLPWKDWTGELYYSHGESSTNAKTFGSVALQKYRTVVEAADYGYNGTFRSNATGNNPGFNSVATPCTSGFYDTLFNNGAAPSADCLYAVQATLQESTNTQQDVMELNFQGGLFNTWAGEVRAAAGYQFRRNAAQFTPDQLQSSASIDDQAVGISPTGYMDAEVRAHDIYAEALVPLLKDSFLKKVELELGARYSQYNLTDSTLTWKALANIQFTDWVRFRGGFNRATRAPNLGELFLPQQQGGPGAASAYGDPCSLRSNSPFGAGGAFTAANATQIANNVFAGVTTPTLAPGQTAAGAQSARLICQAQMNALNADPLSGTAATYYNTQAQVTTTNSGFNNQRGSTSLQSEVAGTWTVGLVFSSPFESPALRNMTATLDWYKIDINDVIEQYSATYAQWLCYGQLQVTDAAGAAAQAASPACQGVPRSADTGIGQSTLLSYSNQGSVSTSGIDFAFNWRSRFEDMGLARIPGGMSFGIQGSWLQSYKTKASEANFDPWTEWKGSLGPTLSGFDGGAYTYRLLTNLAYNVSGFNVNLRWRHLPSAIQAADAATAAIVKNDAGVSATGKGVLLSWVPSSNQAIDSYDTFDLAGSWTINDTIQVRAGVNNLFNTQPVLTAVSNGFQQGTNLSALCTGKVAGCTAPTSYTLPNAGLGTTNPGYYDVMGRTYFVGVRASF
ncbi:MAG TPA: TonB-dependent receptor [Steroidobacteraceae bacterium]|jgi:outer membrane receptor protein involved in Fe transport